MNETEFKAVVKIVEVFSWQAYLQGVEDGPSKKQDKSRFAMKGASQLNLRKLLKDLTNKRR